MIKEIFGYWTNNLAKMIKIKRRQAYLCILISLLIYGLTWYGVTLTLNNATFSFNFQSVNESPFDLRASLAKQLTVWQINEANLSTIDKVSEQKCGKITARNPGDEKTKLKYGLPNKRFNPNSTESFVVYYPGTAFALNSVTNYQNVDIPPPYISAS